MKKSLRCVSVLAALQIVSLGAANAAVVTSTETFGQTFSVFLTPSNISYEFVQPFELPGFNSATDTILSASLELFFRDDKGAGDGSEKVDILINDQLVSQGVNADGKFTYNFSSPFDDIANGLLKIKLIDVKEGQGNSSLGDFYFDESVLTVSVQRNVEQPGGPNSPANNVPEPGSLALAGLGLVGLAVGRKTK